MSAYTPGPWRKGRDGTVVCDAQHAGNHKMDEKDLSFYEGHLLAESIANQADAALMAAAPDLLSACEEWLEIDGPYVSLDEQRKRWGGVVERMAAAVAKARGER